MKEPQVDTICIMVKETTLGKYLAVTQMPGRPDLPGPLRDTFEAARQDAIEMQEMVMAVIADTPGTDVLGVEVHDNRGKN